MEKPGNKAVHLPASPTLCLSLCLSLMSFSVSLSISLSSLQAPEVLKDKKYHSSVRYIKKVGQGTVRDGGKGNGRYMYNVVSNSHHFLQSHFETKRKARVCWQVHVHKED